MIFVLAILVVTVFGLAGSLAYTTKKTRALARPSVPLEIPAPRYEPKLPTLTDRWLMEQEHILYPSRTPQEHDHIGCRVCGPGPLGRWEVPSQYDHVYYKNVRMSDLYGGDWDELRKVATPAEAQVVSSEIEGSKYHTLMLDLDMPCRLVESSTPGHFHLYADKPMTWRQYKNVLKAMCDAGLIEAGFYWSSTKRNATHLRPPWVEKEQA